MNLLKKILKYFVEFIPDESILRIISGPIKGLKWIKGSGNNSYWLGLYERKKANLFKEKINEGYTVFDIGAHVGYYTLIASQKVGSKGKVFSFEPNKKNLKFLKKHKKLNNFENINIFPYAVSEKEGSSFFKYSKSSYTGRISKDQKGLKIKTIQIDNFVNKNKINPSVMKIDVEGEEFNVLKGSKNTLNKYKPILFIATHGREVHEKTKKLLKQIDYKIEFLNHDEILAYV